MTTLYLLTGLPGAGKSTRARELLEATKAVHLNPDDWVVGLGMSLVDYEFRFKLQDVMLVHAAALLRAGTSVIVEFGSWSRAERDGILAVARSAGVSAELHFLDALLDELVQRVLTRGGPGASALANDVLIANSANFERPSDDEAAQYDRYVG